MLINSLHNLTSDCPHDANTLHQLQMLAANVSCKCQHNRDTIIVEDIQITPDLFDKYSSCMDFMLNFIKSFQECSTQLFI